MDSGYRIGEAAAALGVRVETLRRWEREGKLTTERTSGGQRVVPSAEVARLLAERRTQTTLSVLAASSLTEAFGEIGTDFENAHDGVTVRFSFGPSDGLAQQIQAGGPTDVFASASP